jgi:hypothetical protein
VSTPAIVIELQPVHAELARLRRALGEAWSARNDLGQVANVLLEAHGSLEVLDGLADELAIRAARGDTA